MSDGNSKQPVKSVPTRKKLFQVAMILLVVGGAVLWEQVIEDRVIPKHFGVVREGSVYRSGQLSASLVKRTLAKYNIRVIVDLTGDQPGDVDQEAEKQAATELGIERVRLPLRGNGTGNINKYALAIAAIVKAEEQGMPVLLHCAAGAQRTGGVIAAYRLSVRKEAPSFVLAELMRYDHDPEDNAALLPYLNSQMSELASLLKQMGVMDDIPSPLPQLHARH